MGDPRKTRKKFKGPEHPWQAWRIAEEKDLKNSYGLKNKREIWKHRSELRRINAQAKKLIREKAKNNLQAIKEEKQLLDRLSKLGLVHEGATLADVLSIELKNFLDRRLQSIIYKQGLVMTPKQARQFIIHGHVFLNGKKLTVPSYIVAKGEEHLITFNPNSSVASDEHPERVKKLQSRKAIEDKAKLEKKAEVEADNELSEKELERIEKEIGPVEEV